MTAAGGHRERPGEPRRRRFETSALAAFAPALLVLPFCLLALAVMWLAVRLVWDVPYWAWALAYVAASALLFIRPIQALVLTPLFGARRPTAEERRVIEPLWKRLAQANHLPDDRYIVRVLPRDELNAFACGGHLVVVTTFALTELTERELAGVLAHELSHHLGLHTFALTIHHWLSWPVVLFARIGFALENVARAASSSFGANSFAWSATGKLLAALLSVAALPFTGGLALADGAANLVGHRNELQADQRAIRMGYGRHLAAALRRVIAVNGSERPVGWRARLAASHPPARTRVAMIDATMRHPTRRPATRPDPLAGPERLRSWDWRR